MVPTMLLMQRSSSTSAHGRQPTETMAKCGKRLAVGIGSNKIKRERSVKLAMAITYAVHRRVEFVEAWASSVANKIAAAAEVALDATGWSAHGPLQHSASGHSPRASDKSPMLTIGASSETTLRNVQRAPSGAPPKATRPLPAAPPHQPRDTSKALSWLSCVASEDNTHLAWAPPLASSSSSSSGCHYVSQRSQLQHTRPRQVSASPKEGGQAKRAGALHITSPSGLDVVAASKQRRRKRTLQVFRGARRPLTLQPDTRSTRRSSSERDPRTALLLLSVKWYAAIA
eukprot:CAMPEP_0180423070 /NCGR_PEP_ID=MMETSP1036_2-20121128/4019_1 /TAXON_ID=632150 /ORGANISM="Azadinium spinosum, Strain 3D9" /LENGTH=285 /DNA_ID=CAMNT_0022428439 /DNA_START=86 /DNA_END=940 /DNA_ORIENTATION=+